MWIFLLTSKFNVIDIALDLLALDAAAIGTQSRAPERPPGLSWAV